MRSLHYVSSPGYSRKTQFSTRALKTHHVISCTSAAILTRRTHARFCVGLSRLVFESNLCASQVWELGAWSPGRMMGQQWGAQGARDQGKGRRRRRRRRRRKSIATTKFEVLKSIGTSSVFIGTCFRIPRSPT